MKKLRKLLEKKWFALSFGLCIAVLLYLIISRFDVVVYGLGQFWLVIRPVVWGLVFAYLLNPVVVFFEDRVFKKLGGYWVRHILGVILTMAALVIVITLIGVVLVPVIIDSVSVFVRGLPGYVDQVTHFSSDIFQTIESFGLNIPDFSADIDQFIDIFVSQITAHMGTIVHTSLDIGSTLFSAAIGLILGIYFLVGKQRLVNGLVRFRKSVLRKETYEKHTAFFKRCNYIILRFVGCDLLDGLIIGITNLVPTFGPLVGGIISALILLFVNPVFALIFVIFSIVLQTVDGYIIKPKLFGDVLGVPPVWILISIVVGGALFGVIGILLAIPLAAIISFAYDEYLLPYLINRREKKEKEKEEG